VQQLIILAHHLSIVYVLSKSLGVKVCILLVQPLNDFNFRQFLLLQIILGQEFGIELGETGLHLQFVIIKVIQEIHDVPVNRLLQIIEFSLKIVKLLFDLRVIVGWVSDNRLMEAFFLLLIV